MYIIIATWRDIHICTWYRQLACESTYWVLMYLIWIHGLVENYIVAQRLVASLQYRKPASNWSRAQQNPVPAASSFLLLYFPSFAFIGGRGGGRRLCTLWYLFLRLNEQRRWWFWPLLLLSLPGILSVVSSQSWSSLCFKPWSDEVPWRSWHCVKKSMCAPFCKALLDQIALRCFLELKLILVLEV